MKVCIKFVGWPASKFGKSHLWLVFEEDRITLGKLLNELELQTGIKINLDDVNVTVLVNGKFAEFIGGLNAEIKDLDEVLVTNIAGGG